MVFNPGQHVNGATSPAGVGLAVLAIVVPGGYTYFKLKLLSLLFGLLTVVWSKKLIDTFDWPRWTKVVAYVSVGLSVPVALASASGLETTVDSFAVVGLLTELKTGRAFSAPLRASAFGVTAVLSRPEALVVVGFLAVASLVVERRVGTRRALAWVGGPIVAEAAVLIGNRLYYRAWVPNTFQAKNEHLPTAVHQGWQYLKDSIYPVPVRDLPGVAGHLLFVLDVVCTAMLWVALMVGAVYAMRYWQQYGYLLAAFGAQALFVLKAGGDWMHGGRFLEPVSVCIAVGQTLGFLALARLLRGVNTSGLLAAATAVIAGTTAYWCAGPTHADPISHLASGIGDRALVAAGGYMALWSDGPTVLSCVGPGSLVAMSEVGYAPWVREDLRILDLRGLTNRQIADSSPLSMHYPWGVYDSGWYNPVSPVGEVILVQKPVMIVTVDYGPTTILNGEYHLLATVAYPHSSHMLIYLRAGFGCRTPSPAALNPSATVISPEAATPPIGHTGPPGP